MVPLKLLIIPLVTPISVLFWSKYQIYLFHWSHLFQIYSGRNIKYIYFIGHTYFKFILVEISNILIPLVTPISNLFWSKYQIYLFHWSHLFQIYSGRNIKYIYSIGHTYFKFILVEISNIFIPLVTPISKFIWSKHQRFISIGITLKSCYPSLSSEH